MLRRATIISSFTIVCLAISSGCSHKARATVRALEPLALKTDREEYTSTKVGSRGGMYNFRIIARLVNETDSSVYLTRCYPDSPHPTYGITLADDPGELRDHRQSPGYDPVWACVGHDRNIEVRPHSGRVDTLTVRGPNTWDGHTHQAFGVLEGRFRLQYEARSCSSDRACPSSRQPLLSNDFRVSVER